MAIPVKFQQFKSAGIYRIVYDKSTVLGTEAELLRLVVGYSPKGPFNTPVYIKSVSEFKTIFGDVSIESIAAIFKYEAVSASTLEVPLMSLRFSGSNVQKRVVSYKLGTERVIVWNGCSGSVVNCITFSLLPTPLPSENFLRFKQSIGPLDKA